MTTIQNFDLLDFCRRILRIRDGQVPTEISETFDIGFQHIEGLPSQSAVVSENVIGDNEVIPAQGIKTRIRIKHLVLYMNGANNVILRSGTTSLSGTMNFLINQGFTFDGELNPLVMNENEAFNLNLSAALFVTGFVIWDVERLT